MPATTGGMVVYVPVHYDFSQIEFVAPFLLQYPESKLFVYKWHSMKDRIINYYRDSLEYKSAKLSIYTFSLKNIVRCILSEPEGRSVVFLLTASTAYGFGSAQRALFQNLKQTIDGLLPSDYNLRSPVWGVSVIGHCLYGCMSCKGNDHRVPVLFTRFFQKCIPYTAETIRCDFGLKANSKSVKSVLCAPSYGSTSLLQVRPILNYLKQLEKTGKFKFVWKFHPAVYNMSNYEGGTTVEKTERENLDWIIANFRVTDEEQPCLLPFLEAFDLILCDLHSSVPFIASYFCPKGIICFWNDADYDVPATRDEAFLANLSVFQTLDELVPFLNPSGSHATSKGDPSFFYSMYGKVDGNEVQRFAHLSSWPQMIENSSAPKARLPLSSSLMSLRNTIGCCAVGWEQLYLAAKNAPTLDDEDLQEEYATAMGIPKQVSLDDSELITILNSIPAQKTSTLIGTIGGRVRILSQNLWDGSEGCYRKKVFAGINSDKVCDLPTAEITEKLLRYTAQNFLDSGADVICCQEIDSLPRVENLPNSRVNCLPRIAEIMTQLSGVKWNDVFQGNLTPSKTCLSAWGILTRFHVLKMSPNKFGALVSIPRNAVSNSLIDDFSFWIFNVHLPFYPYEPYQISKPQIKYGESPPLLLPSDAVNSAQKSRGKEVSLLLSDIFNSQQVQDRKCDIILCGDFNEPSCLDWTRLALIAGYHSCIVPWPTTSEFLCAGFHDCVREVIGSSHMHPHFTWCCYNEEFENENGAPEGWFSANDKGNQLDKAERIDYVLHKAPENCNNALYARKVITFGNGKSLQTGMCMQAEGLVDMAIACENWTSDHRGVLVEFDIVQMSP